MEILDVFAKRSIGFLHGGGSKATSHLLAQLKLKGNEKILEVGVGTGASLVAIKSIFPKVNIIGVEVNSTMRKKAKKRLQFCGVSNVSIYDAPMNAPYPFPDSSFDIILLESVLAIQSLEGIHWMLSEFNRLLKNGGQLAFNETIWLPNQDPLKIKAFNESCLNHFGIIQSNDQLLDVNAWKNLLVTQGWEIEYCTEVEAWRGKMQYGWRNKLSLLFSFLGVMKTKFHPQQIRETKQIKKIEKEIYAKNNCKMNAYIFISKKVE